MIEHRDKQHLDDIAARILPAGSGILAADESTNTIGKRFEQVGVANTEDNRRAYREMLFAASSALRAGVGGVITYEETLRGTNCAGTPFPQVLRDAGVVTGIKVDAGTTALPSGGEHKHTSGSGGAGGAGETITSGLDGLASRLQLYKGLGAEFTKWRSVYSMRAGRGPSRAALAANTATMAQYAAFAQAAGMVPIVEPELLADGEHSLLECAHATEVILRAQFDALARHEVALEGIILKPNMVTAGNTSGAKHSHDEIAQVTATILRRTVPAAVPAIAFLSGGQSEVDATAHLNAINQLGNLPWKVTFSYGRALQASALHSWRGASQNCPQASHIFEHRVKMNSLAARGKWQPSLENA